MAKHKCERECLICVQRFDNGNALRRHVESVHGLSTEAYTIKCIYNGVRPLCLECGSETRFTQFSFRRYCCEHSHIAESIGGKKGGSAPAWNKGLTKDDDPRVAAVAENSRGDKNSFFGKKHSQETIDAITSSKRLDWSEVISRIESTKLPIELISCEKDYVGQNHPLIIRCNICMTESAVSLANIVRCWSCRTCNPAGSRQELEIISFVNSLGCATVHNAHDVITPLELDIWIPSERLAIEHHGLYWHAGGREGSCDRQRHRRKLERCEQENVRLIQLFSDEWLMKRQICESMIAHVLGRSSKKIGARECIITRENKQSCATFFNENHLTGATRQAKAYFGLRYNDELVAALSVREPLRASWKKTGALEVARMAFKVGTTVIGGASKLFSEVVDYAMKEGYRKIVTYADLRYGTGAVYERCGFTRLPRSNSIDYFYTDGIRRFHRSEFMGRDGMTELQLSAAAGVRPIYGAGNAVFVKEVQ